MVPQLHYFIQDYLPEIRAVAADQRINCFRYKYDLKLDTIINVLYLWLST